MAAVVHRECSRQCLCHPLTVLTLTHCPCVMLIRNFDFHGSRVEPITVPDDLYRDLSYFFARGTEPGDVWKSGATLSMNSQLFQASQPMDHVMMPPV